MAEGNKTLKNSKRFQNSSASPCLLLLEDATKALDWSKFSCDMHTYIIPAISRGTAKSVLQHLFHLHALKHHGRVAFAAVGTSDSVVRYWPVW